MNSLPAGWTKNRMKYCVTLNPNYSKNLNDSDSISFIPMECLTNGSICPKTDVVGRVKTGYTFFADGDIIMAKVTPCYENGNIAIVQNLLNGIGFGTSELYVFRCKTLDTTYLFYFLQNDQFKQLCIGTMYGTGGLKRVSLDFIRNYTFYVPPFAKQQQIASFLDTKCSLIDTTIEKEREVIDKLKEYRQAVITEAVTKGTRPGVPMKDSGVEWIGEIPEGWDVIKLGLVADVQTGPFGSQLHNEDYVEEGTPIITVEHFGDNIIKHSNLPLISDEDVIRLKKYILAEGDLVFSRVGSVDRCVLVSHEENGWLFSGRCLRVRLSNNINKKYINYCFNKKAFREYMNLIAVGSTMPSINTSILSNVKIPIPSLEEQTSIVFFLDAKCSAIDATIQKRELAIEKLTAYRQSLIYECVTGKKEVLG